jgi:hypothetical protein
VAAAPVAVPAPFSIWTFLGLTPEAKAACLLKLCNSPLGLLLTNSIKPVSALSGGIISGCCPAVPSDAAILAAAQSSEGEGAAAAILRDEAGAKARRAAARYLSTVDCHWWPEAQDGLIGFLRLDKNECVRLEAAIGLGRGCCCTKPVIVALIIVVKGSDEDGKPAENSERVKAAAAASLAHCLSCYYEVTKVGEGPKGPELTRRPPQEKLPLTATPTKPLSEFAKKIQAIPMEKLMEEARQTLARTSTSVAPPGMAQEGKTVGERRGHSILEVMAKAFTYSGGSRHLQNMTASVDSEQGPSPEPAVANNLPEPPPAVKTVVHQEQDPQIPDPPTPVATNGELGIPSYSTTSAPIPPSPAAPEAKQDSSYCPAAAAPSPSSPPASEAKKESSYCPATAAPSPSSPAASQAKKESSYCPAGANLKLTAPMATAGSSYCPATSSPRTPAELACEGKSCHAPLEQVSQKSGDQSNPPPAAQPQDEAIVNHHQMLSLLKESIYPEQRAWAAENMSSFNWHLSPEIADGLISTACKDTVGSVRTACIRCMVRMNINTPAAWDALTTLKTDTDTQVRSEAEKALAKVSRPD